MDAAAQLAHCGIDHLHRPSPFSSAAAWNCRSRNHRFFPRIRRNAVVRAVATEPKPSDTEPAPFKMVNGTSTVGFYSLHFISGEIGDARHCCSC